MESIRELRQRLQGDKLKLRASTWGYRYLRRGLSIYITALLIRTTVRPNHVTVAMLAAGVAGAACLALGFVLPGFILAYLNVVLDAVDGEVARYKNMHSLRGMYLDRVNHLLVPGLFFLALSWYAGGLFSAPDPAVLLFGAAGAFLLPVSLASGYIQYQLFIQAYRSSPERFPNVPNAREKGATPAKRRASILQLLRQLMQFVVMIMVFAAGALAEWYMAPAGHPILGWLIIGYGALLCMFFVRDLVAGYHDILRRVGGLGAL